MRAPPHLPFGLGNCVRLSFGVAVLLGACFGPLGPESVVPPDCPVPAPLHGEYDSRAPGYLVLFRSGVDGARETARLARRHDFTPSSVFRSFSAFAADLHPVVVARLRCEPSVALIDHNGVLFMMD